MQLQYFFTAIKQKKSPEEHHNKGLIQTLSLWMKVCINACLAVSYFLVLGLLGFCSWREVHLKIQAQWCLGGEAYKEQIPGRVMDVPFFAIFLLTDN